MCAKEELETAKAFLGVESIGAFDRHQQFSYTTKSGVKYRIWMCYAKIKPWVTAIPKILEDGPGKDLEIFENHIRHCDLKTTLIWIQNLE